MAGSGSSPGCTPNPTALSAESTASAGSSLPLSTRNATRCGGPARERHLAKKASLASGAAGGETNFVGASGSKSSIAVSIIWLLSLLGGEEAEAEAEAEGVEEGGVEEEEVEENTSVALGAEE